MVGLEEQAQDLIQKVKAAAQATVRLGNRYGRITMGSENRSSTWPC